MSLADSFVVCYIYFINIGAVLASEHLLYINKRRIHLAERHSNFGSF